MVAPPEYTLILNIGPDADPAVVAAIAGLLQTLQRSGSTAKGTCVSVLASGETEFVTYYDLEKFVQSLEGGSKASVHQKAEGSWMRLDIVGGRREPEDGPQPLLYVCTTCKKVRGQCRCPSKGHRYTATDEWVYIDYSNGAWYIERQSLLAMDLSLLDELMQTTRARLLAFIEHIRHQHE